MSRKSRRPAVRAVLVGLAVALAAGAVAGSIGVANASDVAATTQASTQTTNRRYLGDVTRPTTFELTADAGTYVVEYDVTQGVVFYGTEVDGQPVGLWVGGPTGTYRTVEFSLTAGVHTIRSKGPEGSGNVSVFLVKV
jgi:hypothetical protein